jgi:hypothetical protein
MKSIHVNQALKLAGVNKNITGWTFDQMLNKKYRNSFSDKM